MRRFNLISMLVALMTCALSAQNVNNDVKPMKQKLVVFVYDISQSTESFGTLTEQHLTKIFDHLAFNGGGTFVAIRIQSNSSNQDVVCIDVPRVDTLSLSGNIYQRSKRLGINRKTKESLASVRKEFVQKTKACLMIPKTECKTDLWKALELGMNSLKLSVYSHFEKHLIIVSDLKDNVSKNRNAVMSFPSDVSVIAVRPDPQALTRLKGDTIMVSNTIEEAIKSITY